MTPALRFLFQKSFSEQRCDHVEWFGQNYDGIVTKVRENQQNTKR